MIASSAVFKLAAAKMTTRPGSARAASNPSTVSVAIAARTCRRFGIIDGLGGPPVEDGTVILRGGKIEYAGAFGTAVVPRDAQIIDAKGKSVLPGLADMHVHLQGGWDGISVDLLGYQRYLNAMLYSGITTLLDTGNYQPWILQLRQEVASGHLLGPRIYCTGAMIDAAEPAWPDLAYALSTRAQIPEFVQRDKHASVDMIKGYANLSDRMLRYLVEEAHKEKIRVVIDQWERNGSPDLVRSTSRNRGGASSTRYSTTCEIPYGARSAIAFIPTDVRLVYGTIGKLGSAAIKDASCSTVTRDGIPGSTTATKIVPGGK